MDEIFTDSCFVYPFNHSFNQSVILSIIDPFRAMLDSCIALSVLKEKDNEERRKTTAMKEKNNKNEAKEQ